MRNQFRVMGVVASASILLLAGCGKSGSKQATGTTTTASAAPTTTTTTLPPQNVAADTALAKAATLRLTDLPQGWTGAPHDDSGDDTGIDAELAKCLGVSVQQLNENGPADVNSPDFSDADGGTTISNDVGYEPTVATAQKEMATFTGAKVPSCLATALNAYLQAQLAHPSDPSDSLPPGVTFGAPVVTQLAFPTIGDQSRDYRTEVGISGDGLSLKVYVDLAVATKGRAGVEMDFSSTGTPLSITEEEHYMKLVVGRLTNTT
jgi:hypothetical protein